MPEAPSLEQFVEQQLQSGKYQSYEDMVQEGLRLLQEREQEFDRIAEKLRSAAERFARGEPGVPFDVDDIIQRGMARLTANNGNA
ncbi:MAG TPA: type II toxin-antitoxin system ParD family antitoxin [Candidatus Tectomicrobia bacterium]